MIKCRFENNSEAELRHCTVDAIIINNGKVLLSKRGYYKGKPIIEFGKWAFIGGYLDRNETLVEGLKREVLEESGCKIKNIKLFRIVDNPIRPNEQRQNVSFIFVVDFVSRVEAKTEEVLELKWFDLNNLPPKEQIAFDHSVDLQMYVDMISNKDLSNYPNRFPADIF